MTLLNVRVENHPQQTAKRGARDNVDDRETLPEEFERLDDEYGPFTLDVAAAPHNTKCERFYTREQDALTMAWRGVVWCNPPYSDIGEWVQKAWQEWGMVGHDTPPERIVMLLPANRTEQRWWQTWVEPYRDRPDFDVRFLPGRMRFIRPAAVIGPKGDRPPFGNCLLIWTRPAVAAVVLS